MRTSDSLADDESYFFSELKRLKFIVDQMDVDNYFIVLDEILKCHVALNRSPAGDDDVPVCIELFENVAGPIEARISAEHMPFGEAVAVNVVDEGITLRRV